MGGPEDWEAMVEGAMAVATMGVARVEGGKVVAMLEGEWMAEAVAWMAAEVLAGHSVAARLAEVETAAGTQAAEALGSAALLEEDQERVPKEGASAVVLQEALEAVVRTALSHQRRAGSAHPHTPRPQGIGPRK